MKRVFPFIYEYVIFCLHFYSSHDAVQLPHIIQQVHTHLLRDQEWDEYKKRHTTAQVIVQSNNNKQ